jgi:hypothetical protein
MRKKRHKQRARQGLSRLAHSTKLSSDLLKRIHAHHQALDFGCVAYEVSVFDTPQLSYDRLVEQVDNASKDQLLYRRDCFYRFLLFLIVEEKIFLLESSYLRWRFNFRRRKKSLRQQKTKQVAYVKKQLIPVLLSQTSIELNKRIAIELTENADGRLLLTKRNLLLLGHDEHRCTVIAQEKKHIEWLRSFAARFDLYLLEWNKLI